MFNEVSGSLFINVPVPVLTAIYPRQRSLWFHKAWVIWGSQNSTVCSWQYSVFVVVGDIIRVPCFLETVY